MRLTRSKLRLYLVTDTDLCATQGMVATVQAAVAGGVTMVQLRDKEARTASLVDMARALKAALAGSGVPLVINDDIDAALISEADGCHVGQGDVDVAEARQRLGPDRFLGLSCETETHVKAVDTDAVDYLGIGTVFATDTKPDHTPPIELVGLKALCSLSALPTVAIGGLKARHTRSVLQAGADGLAVSSAICGVPDPAAAAREFFDCSEVSLHDRW